MIKHLKSVLLKNKIVREKVANLKMKTVHLKKIKQYEDDTFLVSYPRSGSNLLRFLIANLISIHKTSEYLMTFKQARIFMPNFPDKRFDDFFLNLNRPRFIKTHHAFATIQFPKVIYIYRDGRDVYYSYFNWGKKQNLIPSNMLFSDFLQETLKSQNKWSEHILSWTNKYPEERMLLIKYEDLIKNKLEVLKKVSEFINIPTNNQVLNQLIDISDFSKMSKTENNKEDVVLNKGTSGGWKKEFSKQDIEVFKMHENKALIKLGYESSYDW